MPDYGTARADFPGGDARQLFRSIRRLMSLPDETRLFLCHDYKAPGRDDYAWETTVGQQREGNVHVHEGVSEDEFVAMRTSRDATLSMPKLIMPSIQVNMRGGHLPEPEDERRPLPQDSAERGMTLPGYPDAAPLAGLAGGVMIGLAAAVMLLGLGRIAGVSGLAARAVGLGGSGIARSGAWMFVIGLPLGALHRGAGIGRNRRPLRRVPLRSSIAGLIVGIGTRLGSGCTSGHGVCGMSAACRPGRSSPP